MLATIRAGRAGLGLAPLTRGARVERVEAVLAVVVMNAPLFWPAPAADGLGVTLMVPGPGAG